MLLVNGGFDYLWGHPLSSGLACMTVSLLCLCMIAYASFATTTPAINHKQHHGCGTNIKYSGVQVLQHINVVMISTTHVQILITHIHQASVLIQNHLRDILGNQWALIDLWLMTNICTTASSAKAST